MSRTSPRTVLLVLLLWLAGLGAAGQFAKFAVPFEEVRALYPAAGASAGWLLTLISAIGSALGIVAGALVARLGCRRLLVVALLLGGVISLWQSSFPALPVMMASRVIEGISHLVLVVAAPTLVAQISSDRFRGAAMALWSTFFGVSFALVAWFGTPLVEASGLSSLFMVHGGAMIALAALLAFLLPSDSRNGTGDLGAFSAAPILLLHARAYSSPFIAAPAVGWLFYTLTFVSLLTLLPALMPPALRSTVTGMMPLASIAVSLGLVPILLLSHSAVATTVLGFLLSILIVGAFFLVQSVTLLPIALFAALGLVQGASFASVPELNVSYQDRALANGAMAQMGNLGNLLGTPFLLALLETAGVEAAFVAIMGLYSLAALCHLAMARARRKRRLAV